MSKRLKHWYVFEGVRVSVTDEEACGAPCEDYMCTRLKRHDGDHIAHVFDEETGRPVEVVAVDLLGSDNKGWDAPDKKMYHWYEDATAVCGTNVKLSMLDRRKKKLPKLPRYPFCKKCLKKVK